MATNQQDIEAINSRFAALWPSEVPYILDNSPNIPESDQTWARLSVQPGSSGKPFLGSTGKYRQLGRIYLQIFVPAELGTYEGWALAETFTAIFRDWKSADYRIRVSTPEFRASDDEKEYFTITCSVRYTAEH